MKILIILIYIFLLVSCRREKDNDEPIVLLQDESISSEYNGSVSGTSNNEQPIVLTPLEPAESLTPRTRAVPVSANHSLLHEQNMGMVTPEDFEIGPLLVFLDKIEEKIKNNVYREFINDFFNELKEGYVPIGMLSQENLFFLTSIFNSYIERNQIPDNIRIGKVVHIRDGLRLNLRMFKGQNRTGGEIILVETEAGLKIREFYGDLGILDVEYIRANERFEPEYYRF